MGASEVTRAAIAALCHEGVTDEGYRLPHSVMFRTMDIMQANGGPCGCERNGGRQGFANAKRMRKGDGRGAKGKR